MKSDLAAAGQFEGVRPKWPTTGTRDEDECWKSSSLGAAVRFFSASLCNFHVLSICLISPTNDERAL
jgi:hypothetical protein